MKKTSIWRTKCSDLTVGQSVKFGVVAGILACVPYMVATAVLYKDEIGDWFTDHFGRQARREVASTSEEDEEDWGT